MDQIFSFGEALLFHSYCDILQKVFISVLPTSASLEDPFTEHHFSIVTVFHPLRNEPSKEKNHLEIDRLSYDRSAKDDTLFHMIGNEFDDNEGQYYRCLSHDKQRQIMIMMIMMLDQVLYDGDDHMRFYHHTMIITIQGSASRNDDHLMEVSIL